MPRVVSGRGATISGVYLPEGYRVGIDPAVIQCNKGVFGPDTGDFKPNHWLESDTARMDGAMPQFGAGTRSCTEKNIALSEIYNLVPQVLRLLTRRLADPTKSSETNY